MTMSGTIQAVAIDEENWSNTARHLVTVKLWFGTLTLRLRSNDARGYKLGREVTCEVKLGPMPKPPVPKRPKRARAKR